MMHRTAILCFVSLVLFGFAKQYIFQKISMDMEVRSVSGGKSLRTKASIYYTSEGKMISYLVEPQEMVIVNNKKGEVTIYNPAKNTVETQQNYLMGTETNQLYYFLENKRSDLGLVTMDYTIKSTRIENGLKITEWSPPLGLMKDLQKVELVHEKGNPIYMAYHAANGDVVKKIFFYSYTKVSDYISLPSAVTQIDFRSPKDSTITKTVYTQFRLNQQVSDEKLSFTVPSNAKIIK